MHDFYTQVKNVIDGSLKKKSFLKTKKDLSMLTNNVKRKMIKGPFKMIPNMMKMIYFNDKYPENKTLKLINRKENILQVHRNEGWEYVDKESVIDEIIDNTNYEVDTYYDVKSEDFSKFAKKTYNRFKTMFDSRDKNNLTYRGKISRSQEQKELDVRLLLFHPDTRKLRWARHGIKGRIPNAEKTIK